MTKETANCMLRLAKIVISHMRVSRHDNTKRLCADPKKLCGEGNYTSLNHNANHKKKHTRCPHGHVPLLFGDEGKRYFIPIAYLSHQVFAFLFDKTREEFKYKQ